MATYSDHQQRMLDQGADFDRVLEARRRVRVPGLSSSSPGAFYSLDPCGCVRDVGGTVTNYCPRHAAAYGAP